MRLRPLRRRPCSRSSEAALLPAPELPPRAAPCTIATLLSRVKAVSSASGGCSVVLRSTAPVQVSHGTGANGASMAQSLSRSSTRWSSPGSTAAARQVPRPQRRSGRSSAPSAVAGSRCDYSLVAGGTLRTGERGRPPGIHASGGRPSVLTEISRERGCERRIQPLLPISASALSSTPMSAGPTARSVG